MNKLSIDTTNSTINIENYLDNYLEDDSILIPSNFNGISPKFFEFLIISKFVYQNYLAINTFITNTTNTTKSTTDTTQENSELNINLKDSLSLCQDYFKIIKDKKHPSYETYSKAFYLILNEFNIKYRLKLTLEDLKKIEKNYPNGMLPNSTPCEYVDQSLWQTYNEDKDKENFIGHGWYWREGDCKTKDIQGAGDYDSLEDNFFRIKTAKVAVCDYELLKNDFDNPYISSRFDLITSIFDAKKIQYEIISAQGNDIWSQKLSLVLLGDWISYYLAILNNIDPTPVPIITETKNS